MQSMPMPERVRVLLFVAAIAAVAMPIPSYAQAGGGGGRGGLGGVSPATLGLPEIAKGTGFILGRTIDVGSGQPVAGAVVTLTGYGALPGGVPGGPAAAVYVTSSDLTASAPRQVITNSEGYFLFRELAGGRFSIEVNALGYLSGGYLQNKANGTPHFIDLGENEKRGDVQIKLWKYAAIGGTVLDEAGEPAVGATVKILRNGGNGSGQIFLVGTAQTDDRGSYRFGRLTPDNYVVGIITVQSTIPAALAEAYADAQAAQALDRSRPQSLLTDALNNGFRSPSGGGVRIGDLIFQMSNSTWLGYTPPQPADDGRMLSYVTTFFPNSASVSEATTISLGSGEERAGVDLSLRLVPGVRISGTVTGPDGPAKNMGVRLVPASNDRFIDDSFIEAATAVTDQTGAFTLLGVPAGTYTLKSARTQMAIGSTLPMLWAAQPLTVESADQRGIDLVLRLGITVSGHLEFAGAKPAPTGQELQRFSFTLVPAAGAVPQRSSAAIVGTDGTFHTPGDLPGQYFAQVQNASGWTVRSIKYNGRNIANESVEIASTDLSDVVATLTDRPSKLSGTITDAKGAPDVLASVIVFPADNDSWRRGEFNIFSTRLIRASKSGTFSLLPTPGQYYVVAVDDGATSQWTDPRFLERLIPGATKVTVAEGDDKTVTLKTLVIR